jgi:hypothetical protein
MNHGRKLRLVRRTKRVARRERGFYLSLSAGRRRGVEKLFRF